MKNIFVIDDDLNIGNMMEELLAREGYRVTRAYSGTEALLALSSVRPDLVLLDLMLPGLDGRELLPRLSGIPVIVVSAKAGVEDKVDLLLGGAADYVTKPFDTKELIARIAVQLRNAAVSGAGMMLEYRDIVMDTRTHSVYVCGEMVHLTRTEYAILKMLMQNPSQVITKTLLLERISEDTPDCMGSSLRVHVSNLRKKLRLDCIVTVKGIGYKYEVQP